MKIMMILAVSLLTSGCASASPRYFVHAYDLPDAKGQSFTTLGGERKIPRDRAFVKFYGPITHFQLEYQSSEGPYTKAVSIEPAIMPDVALPEAGTTDGRYTDFAFFRDGKFMMMATSIVLDWADDLLALPEADHEQLFCASDFGEQEFESRKDGLPVSPVLMWFVEHPHGYASLTRTREFLGTLADYERAWHDCQLEQDPARNEAIAKGQSMLKQLGIKRRHATKMKNPPLAVGKK